MHFQRRCRLKLFLPYGPMLTKTKTNVRNNNKKIKFENQKKKMSGDLVDKMWCQST